MSGGGCGDLDALEARATSLVESGDPAGAVRVFTTVYERSVQDDAQCSEERRRYFFTRYVSLLVAVGQHYHQSGELKSAAESLSQAEHVVKQGCACMDDTELLRVKTAVQLAIAVFFLATGKPRVSLRYLDQVQEAQLVLNANGAQVCINRASALVAMGRYNRAMDELRHANQLARAPDAADTDAERALLRANVYFSKGAVYEHLRSLSKAHSAYSKCAETCKDSDSTEAVALARRARSAMKQLQPSLRERRATSPQRVVDIVRKHMFDPDIVTPRSPPESRSASATGARGVTRRSRRQASQPPPGAGGSDASQTRMRDARTAPAHTAGERRAAAPGDGGVSAASGRAYGPPTPTQGYHVYEQRLRRRSESPSSPGRSEIDADFLVNPRPGVHSGAVGVRYRVPTDTAQLRRAVAQDRAPARSATAAPGASRFRDANQHPGVDADDDAYQSLALERTAASLSRSPYARTAHPGPRPRHPSPSRLPPVTNRTAGVAGDGDAESGADDGGESQSPEPGRADEGAAQAAPVSPLRQTTASEGYASDFVPATPSE